MKQIQGKLLNKLLKERVYKNDNVSKINFITCFIKCAQTSRWTRFPRVSRFSQLGYIRLAIYKDIHNSSI